MIFMISIHSISQVCCTLAESSRKFFNTQQKKIALFALAIFSFIASIVYFYGQCFRQISNKAISHLILNLDINRTIVADDPTAGYKLQDILSILVAEHCVANWNGTKMSFREYVDSLIPGSHNGPIKKQRQAILKDFVHLLTHSTFQNEETIDFAKLKEHPREDLEQLKSKINCIKKHILIDLKKLQRLDEQAFEVIKNKILHDYQQMEEKLSRQPHYIFPSFFRLIEWLKTKNVHFHLILRTFGNDAQRIIVEVEKRFPEERFTHIGKYLDGKWMISSLDGNQYTLEAAQDVYRHFRSRHSQHMALQDDWKEWNAHQESREHGKRFLVKMDAGSTHTLFIDDNIEEDPASDKNIVTAINVNNQQLLPLHSLVARKIAVRTDTIAAICNDDYFVKVVQDSLAFNRKAIS